MKTRRSSFAVAAFAVLAAITSASLAYASEGGGGAGHHEPTWTRTPGSFEQEYVRRWQ